LSQTKKEYTVKQQPALQSQPLIQRAPLKPSQPERVVVFDLDGTLIDSHKDIAQAVNYALTSSGRQPLAEHVVTSYVGDGAQKLLARAAGLGHDDPQIEPLMAEFLAYYAAHATTFTTLYPDARETLDALAQVYTLALCTNKPRITTDAVLRELDLTHYFAATVAGDDLPQRKPDPTPLLHIARTLDTTANLMVMVGDGPQDIECARACGVRSVGVVFGMKTPAAMLAAKPDHVVTRFADLLRLFSRHATEPR
jgi:2-phosphoglycolate phosphatase